MGIARKNFGDIITFTRASAATRINHLGQLESVAANVPRIDYDPVTKACKGLLIENQQTNLCLRSQDFVLSWTGSPSAIQSVESYLGFAPFYTLQKTTSGNSEGRSLTISSVVSGNTLTITAAFLAGSSSVVSFGLYASVGAWGNLSDCSAEIISGPGVIGTYSGAHKNVSGLSATEPTLVRITRTFIADAICVVYLYPGGAQSTSIGDSVKATRVQVEPGFSYSSYIPTAGAQVTRAADVPNRNLGSEYNTNEGAIYVEFDYSGSGSSVVSNGRATLALTAETFANSLLMYNQSSFSSGVYSYKSASGNGQVSMNSGIQVPAGQVIKSAISFKQNSFLMSVNGAAALSDTSYEHPVLTKLLLGWFNNSNYLNGHIRKLRYYPKALTAAQLQALTA